MCAGALGIGIGIIKAVAGENAALLTGAGATPDLGGSTVAAGWRWFSPHPAYRTLKIPVFSGKLNFSLLLLLRIFQHVRLLFFIKCAIQQNRASLRFLMK